MAGTHRQRVIELFRACLVKGFLPLRRHLLTVTALMLVTSVILLVLDARLPFPSPGERVLYKPMSWSLLFHSSGVRQPSRPVMRIDSAHSVGGFYTLQPPLSIMLYTARPGDTIGSIATKLGMNIDTISSMNRTAGRGVHNVTVGEQLKIPSQDGIFLPLSGDFDQMCQARGALPEDVLTANGITRADLAQGKELFFPGVQHKGYELALSQGLAVGLPLHGWESSGFGLREDPFTGVRSRHSGVDIAAPYGSAIRSATDGRVVAVGEDEMLGRYVQVLGQGGFSYVYGHMSEIRTTVGARVSQGQLIGEVGTTGYTTGPHLHFEVRKNGVPVNPQLYLPPIR